RSEEELAAADALVDPQLRRTERSWDGFDVPESLCELAERTYVALEARAIDVDGEAVADSAAELDELRAEYVVLYGQAETMVRSSLNAARAKERRKVLKQIKNEQRKAQVARDTATRPVEPARSEGGSDRRATRSPRQVAAGLKSRTTRLLSRRP
nr:hypothetical protein [Nocardioidaceae bacterium]